MESKSPLPQHLGRDISQLGLALRDCARQLRYAARNVPGPIKSDRPVTTRSPATQTSRAPSHLSLESVAQLADGLIETAESFAGHAVPPLQDHWKSPVPLDALTGYLSQPGNQAKTLRRFSTTYYAAAKRMIMQCGATDVLIFEHRISSAFESLNASCHAPGTQLTPVCADAATSRSALCRVGAQLVLSLIDQQPIRSTRFDVLPDASAPWWLVTEPNAYVFLMLTIASLAKDICPAGLVTEPDAVMHFFADVTGAREAAFRRALKEREPLEALSDEIEHVVTHLC